MKKSVFCFLAVVILLLGSTPLPAEEVMKVLSLTLKESIEIALGNNAEILIKSEELKGAAARIREARAHVLPQLSVNADYYNYHDH
ncbi:TolC family protein, partial [candidate division WOR-3 bacterium]|nr:TolC family protein [candidate division WOR-3 bacterium]